MPFPSPSSSSGMYLLNPKGLHKACNQGAMGSSSLSQANSLNLSQGPVFSDFPVSQGSPVSSMLSPSCFTVPSFNKCTLIVKNKRTRQRCLLSPIFNNILHVFVNGTRQKRSVTMAKEKKSNSLFVDDKIM